MTAKSPPRIPEASAELWAEYRLTHATSYRNTLVEHYMPLVYVIAKALLGKLPPSVDEGDLISWGAFGLMRAVAAFDPSRGNKFVSFANFRIRGSMLDGLRDSHPIPRTLRKRYAICQSARQQLILETGRQPTLLELANRVKMEPDQVHQTLREAARHVPSSLDEDHDTDVAPGRQMSQCREADPHDAAARSDARAAVFRGLMGHEVEVLARYHFDQLEYTDVGKLLGIGGKYASVLGARARRKIAARLGYRGVRDLLCA